VLLAGGLTLRVQDAERRPRDRCGGFDSLAELSRAAWPFRTTPICAVIDGDAPEFLEVTEWQKHPS